MGVWLSPAADIDRLEWQAKDPSLSKHPQLRGNEKRHLSVNSPTKSLISASPPNHWDCLTVKNRLFCMWDNQYRTIQEKPPNMSTASFFLNTCTRCMHRAMNHNMQGDKAVNMNMWHFLWKQTFIFGRKNVVSSRDTDLKNITAFTNMITSGLFVLGCFSYIYVSR